MTVIDLPFISFGNPEQFSMWLEKNHQSSQGIWIQFFKKHSGITAITYDEALDVALCYGWIDSQVKRYDAVSYIQKFTPRRAKSIWSKVNTQHALRLIQDGRMQQAGLEQVETAKRDGRWDRAYSPAGEIILPEDFIEALKKNKDAEKFFQTLNKTNIYTIYWRLQTAKKPETRTRRMAVILTMLANRKAFH